DGMSAARCNPSAAPTRCFALTFIASPRGHTRSPCPFVGLEPKGNGQTRRHNLIARKRGKNLSCLRVRMPNGGVRSWGKENRTQRGSRNRQSPQQHFPQERNGGGRLPRSIWPLLSLSWLSLLRIF